MYSGSNTLNDVSWNQGNAEGVAHEGKGKAPNELGIYDMTGNVWERCSDRYDANYYKNSEGATDPQGPTDGGNHVQRGGAWFENTYVMHHRNATRTSGTVDGHNSPSNNEGFRVALDVL
jgi:formylglycine-generating enzyme required for sulfatase activity